MRYVLVLACCAGVLAGCATSKETGLGQERRSLLLYPNSTIQYEQDGVCARITNQAQGIWYVPTVGEAWRNFVEGGYPEVVVKECQAT